MKSLKKSNPASKSQLDNFKDAAHELGADTDEETFDRVLTKIAPVKDAGKPEKQNGDADK